MLALFFNDNLILFFKFNGKIWHELLLCIWSGKKIFFYEPYLSTSFMKARVDMLYAKKTRLKLIWYGVRECDDYFIEANQNSLKNLKTYKNNNENYFWKYHFQKSLTDLVHHEFKLLIIRKMEFKVKIYNYLILIKAVFKRIFFKNYVIGILSFSICSIIIFIYLLKELFTKRRIVSEKKKINRGILIDNIFGIEKDIMNNDSLLPYNDGFLLNINKNFKQNNLILYNKFWDNHSIHHDEIAYNKDGILFVGTRNRKDSITLKGIYKSLKNIVKIYRNLSVNFNLLSSTEYHDSLMRFISKSIVMFWDFDLIKPKVYLSRIDYSFEHHIMGCVCNMINIHFAGISHSPGFGSAIQPNMGILSFDSFFYHADVIKKEFFPSWNLSHTQMYSIGVWRSDIIYKFKKDKIFKNKKREILQKFNCKNVVALHLPVIQVFDIDHKTSQMWLISMLNIVKENPKDLFVVCLRRSNEIKYLYFKIWLNKLLSYQNVILNSKVFKNSMQSYNVAAISDITISPNCSDLFFESVSNDIKAIGYTVKGKSVDYFKFYSNFLCFDNKKLLETYNKVKNNNEDIQHSFNHIKKQIGEADGKCVSRMLNILLEKI